MPWTSKSFASKHNKKLSGPAASAAASQANAMIRRGVPEGEAIATANKTGDRKMGGSPKSKEEHMARRAKSVGQSATGGEFGVSQSTVSRKVRKQGFERMGGA